MVHVYYISHFDTTAYLVKFLNNPYMQVLWEGGLRVCLYFFAFDHQFMSQT